MNEPTKPDPNEFARTVLHNFAGLTAEVYELKLLLARVLSEVTNLPPEKLEMDRFEPLVNQETERLYREFLKRANLPPGPNDEPPPFPGRGVNPTV